MSTLPWRVRKNSRIKRFSNDQMLQAKIPGMLELTISVLARAHSKREIEFLTPLATAATSEAIRKDTGIVCWIHWPDAVTIDGKVVAKAHLTLKPVPSTRSSRAVLSISVDCFAKTSLPVSRLLRTTSILEALGVEIDIDMLRDKILHALDWQLAEWERGMNRKLVDRIAPTIPWLGREIEVSMTNGTTSAGRAKGIDELGSLLLELHQRGRTETIALSPAAVGYVHIVNRRKGSRQMHSLSAT